jgi:predicted nucleic acid-binding protein
MAKKGKSKRKGADFVLDGFVALAWFFEDEADAYAESVADSLARVSALVPSHWHLEVANALVVGERRKRTTEAKSTRFLTLLAALPIRADELTPDKAWHETIALARAHSLSAYDAAYLELALRRDLAIATLDGPLRKAMRVVGIPLYLTT